MYTYLLVGPLGHAYMCIYIYMITMIDDYSSLLYVYINIKVKIYP